MLSWNEYIKNGTVRKAVIDKGTIKALIMTAERNLKVISQIKIDEESASTVFKNHYDSLREICEALALSRGYKIYLHEAIGLFLKSVLNEEVLFIRFDKFRIMRNKLVYYGKETNAAENILAIRQITEMISQIKSGYLNEFIS